MPELPTRLEVVRKIQHPADFVPAGVADGVVAHGVEHSPVGFAVQGRPVGRPWAVLELVRGGGVAQRVVQPGRPQPAGTLALGHAYGAGPLGEQRRHALDVRAALGGDDRPGG